MALPSQAARETHGSRAHVFRRKTRGPGPLAIAGVAGLCVVALLYVVVRPLVWGPSSAKGEGPAGQGDQIHEAEPAPGTGAGTPVASGAGGSGERGGTTGQGAPGASPRGEQTPERIAGPGASGPGVSGPGASGPGAGGPGVSGAGEVVGGGSPRTLATIPDAGAGGGSPGAPAGAGGGVATSESVASALRSADTETQANRPVVAREILLRALSREGVSESDKRRLRDRIGELNQEIVFSPRIYADDPTTGQYVVQGGDSLSRIVGRQGLGVDWRAIQRVNGMASDRIRLGQALKVIRGPFHAVVDKSDFRLDLYAGPPDAREEWRFIRSFPVGLGSDGGTPIGEFIVKRNSRLVNPEWVNPRTGQRFGADDPQNPIGERWVGIRGLGDSAIYEGFGIHGTIEPGSIGQEKSMGCVRMLSGDIEVVYELLMDEVSHVSIVP